MQLDYPLSHSPHGAYVAAGLVHLVLEHQRSHLGKQRLSSMNLASINSAVYIYSR